MEICVYGAVSTVTCACSVVYKLYSRTVVYRVYCCMQGVLLYTSCTPVLLYTNCTVVYKLYCCIQVVLLYTSCTPVLVYNIPQVSINCPSVLVEFLNVCRYPGCLVWYISAILCAGRGHTLYARYTKAVPRSKTATQMRSALLCDAVSSGRDF